MRVGRYELGAEIGRGGSGRVHRARSPEGRDVAVKLLVERRPEVVARFDRESRVLRELADQGGFVPILEHGESSPLGPWIAMPYLSGGTLRARLDHGPLALETALEIGIVVAGALGRAHELGIVHRDVKPENILFAEPVSDPTDPGRPLVADLGVAKHFARSGLEGGASASLSRTGELRGTVAYMAPEQVHDSKSVGPAADVFAWGAVIYEALVGRAPFAAATLVELAVRLDEGRFDSLDRAAPSVPRAVARVVERALARDPGARFADGAALARALEAARDAEPGPGRGKLALAAVGGLLVLGVGVGAGALFGNRPPAPPRPTPLAASPSPSPSLRATPDPSGLDAETRALLAEAWALQHANRLDEAVKVVGRVLARAPRSAEGLALRSFLHAIDRTDPEGARADAAEAVVLDPRLAIARAAVANQRMIARDIDGALAAADEALALDEHCSQAHLIRSEALGVRNDLAGERAELDRILADDPTYLVIYVDRARVRELQGDWDGVIEDANRALASPRSWKPRTIAMLRARCARCYGMKGETARALADAEAAVVADSGSADALFCRAVARQRTGDLPGAVEDARSVVQLDPASASGWALLGRVSFASGDMKGALAASDEALKRNGSNAEALGLQCRVYEKQGNKEALLAVCRKVVKVLPPTSPIAVDARDVLARAGEGN